MNSTKITTNNPLVTPNKLNQKLVFAGKFNELWEDVSDTQTALANAVTALYAAIAAIPTGGGIPEFDKGLAAPLSFTVVNGISVSLTDNGAGVGEALVAFSECAASINYTGANVLLYGIKRGTDPVYTVIDTDPNAALLPFDSTDVGGPVIIDLAISDDNWNTYIEIPAGSYVQVFNPGGLL